MFLQKTHSRSLALLALAFGVTTAQASAQAYKGVVDLPFPVRWGGVALHPGPHTILIENSFTPLIYVSGQGDHAAILTGPVEMKPLSEHGALKLVNAGGSYAVKRLDAGYLGKSFEFLLPKGKRNQIELAAKPGTTVSVALQRLK